MSSPTRKLQKFRKIKKVKVRQYNCAYLKFGFTTAPHDATRPMSLVCGSIFSDRASHRSRYRQRRRFIAVYVSVPFNVVRNTLT